MSSPTNPAASISTLHLVIRVKKKPQKRLNKEHIKEFGGPYMPRKCAGDGLEASLGTSGTSRPDVCAIPHRFDRMSAGQTGHFHGRNGTFPRDGCNPNVGCPGKFLYVCWFFSFLSSALIGSQHPSPIVKTLCNFEPQNLARNYHIA